MTNTIGTQHRVRPVVPRSELPHRTAVPLWLRILPHSILSMLMVVVSLPLIYAAFQMPTRAHFQFVMGLGLVGLLMPTVLLASAFPRCHWVVIPLGLTMNVSLIVSYWGFETLAGDRFGVVRPLHLLAEKLFT